MVKILYKHIYISKDILRPSKLIGSSLKTHKKSTLLTPILLWKHILIYDGKKYLPINITKDKIGFKLGQFVFKTSGKLISNGFKLKLKN